MAEFRVLLVDDEEELVNALVERLRYRDIEAEYALNGIDALHMLKERTFDIVVLDLKLPGMDGTEVLKNIRQYHPEVPVLMITGHGSVTGDEQAKIDEAAAFLAKPIHLEDLIEKMREVIRSQ